MTTIHSGVSAAPTYSQTVDLDALEPRFAILVDELTSHPFSSEALSKALAGGISEAGATLRAIPIQEGRLLERGIAMIADLNPDLAVLTQNVRLPVTKAALELVEKNDPKHYRSLTLDAETGGRKSYTPDLITVNRQTKLAHVVDVKRSLGSYEVSRINELKSRMLAAALIVPDLLYREHHRLVAEEVRVVILNAENQRSDIAGGVWPLSHLDHLVEVTGAGKVVSLLRERFHSRIDENWMQARHSLAGLKAARVPAHPSGECASPNQSETPDMGAGLIEENGQPPARGHIRVGFARMPRAGAG